MTILYLHELIDGAWLVLSLSLTLMFCQYAVYGYGVVSRNSTNAAIALGVYFFGDTMLKAGALLARHYSHVSVIGCLLLIGFIIAFAGMVQIVRVFSAAYWSSWAWVVIGLVAVAAAFTFSAL